MGTIDHVYVRSADQFGGANGSQYPVQSTSVGGALAIPTTTLSLNTASAYFGLWWSAGDANNVLQFYNGNTEVAKFTTGDLLNLLPSTYRGNPNAGTYHGDDSSEKFAFLNFYGLGVDWTSVKFSNNGSSGFESDNWTSRVGAWGTEPGETGPLPGVEVLSITGTQVTVVPEPGTALAMWVFLAVGGVGAGVRKGYRRLCR